MVDMSMPNSTKRQFANKELVIMPTLGRCRRERKASVSSSERRRKNNSGRSEQPASSGTRHPQRVSWLSESVELSRIPSSAANMTDTCWLPDCQAT
jgi:hypothetical protein